MDATVSTAVALAIPQEESVSAIASIASACLARFPSPNTQRAYLRPLTSFLASGRPLTREGISGWLTTRRSLGSRTGAGIGMGAVSHNIALAALKLLAREVWIRGLMDGPTYNAIADLRSTPVRGGKLGQWTDEEGVEKLLGACENARERALIAVMCGCGLRRSEVAGLAWSHYQERAGRAVLADIVGKGGRVRTVAVPRWAAELIDEWKMEVKGEN